MESLLKTREHANWHSFEKTVHLLKKLEFSFCVMRSKTTSFYHVSVSIWIILTFSTSSWYSRRPIEMQKATKFKKWWLSQIFLCKNWRGLLISDSFCKSWQIRLMFIVQDPRLKSETPFTLQNVHLTAPISFGNYMIVYSTHFCPKGSPPVQYAGECFAPQQQSFLTHETVPELTSFGATKLNKIDPTKLSSKAAEQIRSFIGRPRQSDPAKTARAKEAKRDF